MKLENGDHNKVLFFVPHPDDEINLGGGLIQFLVEHNWDVYCAVLTNGDFHIVSSVRFQEFVLSLKAMVVPSENSIFLGYPECDDDEYLKLISEFDYIATSPQSINHTYGTVEYPEFHFSETGKHAAFSVCNIVEDIIRLVDKVKPALVVCNNADAHSVHKLLAYCFDRAKKDFSCDCAIMRGFCYSTSWVAPRDFYSVNIKKTKTKDNNLGNDFEWEKRIRFPVSTMAARNQLYRNSLYKSLLQHKSQVAIANAKSIINGDRVLWYEGGSLNKVPVYCKLTDSEGNFVYRYYCDTENEMKQFSLYICDKGKITILPYRTIKEFVSVRKIGPRKRVIRIDYKVNNETCSDEVEIVVAGKWNTIIYSLVAKAENLIQRVHCSVIKISNRSSVKHKMDGLNM